MKKKIFAVVGYTDWGKSHTLYTLFRRKTFFPLKSPIATERFGEKCFAVINASNEDRLTKAYLDRLRAVLKKHEKHDISFVITVSLIFDSRTHDVKKVFDYLNSLKDYDVNYIVLKESWFGESLKRKDLDEMKDRVSESKIHLFDDAIKKSKNKFEIRTDKIARLMR